MFIRLHICANLFSLKLLIQHNSKQKGLGMTIKVAIDAVISHVETQTTSFDNKFVDSVNVMRRLSAPATTAPRTTIGGGNGR